MRSGELSAPRPKRAIAVGAVLAVLSAGVALARFGPWNREFWLERSSLLALDQRTREHPRDARAWYHLGLRLEEKGDPDQALWAFRQAHSIDGTDARIVARFGQALLEARQVEEAFQILKLAVARLPREPGTRMVLARLYQRRGAYHRAEAEWREALRLDPKQADAWYYLAFCHLQMQQVAQANETIERAIALEPMNPRIRRLRGSIAAAIGDMRAARGAFENAITLVPGDPRSHHDLANFLLSQSRTTEDVRRAEQAVAELARLQPDYPLIVWHRGRIAAARKDWSAAVRYLEETLRVEPALDEAYFHLANAYHRLGRSAAGNRAIGEFRRRSELTRRIEEIRIRMALTDDPDLRFQLASLQRQAGQLSQARESVQQGLQLAPGSARGKAELRAIDGAERRGAKPPGAS